MSDRRRGPGAVLRSVTAGVTLCGATLYAATLYAVVSMLITSPVLSQVAEDLAALEGTPISVREAVERTLRNSYNLQKAEQTVAERAGAWQESGGVFDGSMFFDSSFELRQQELLRAQLTPEIKRRVPLELLAISLLSPDGPPGALDRAANAIQNRLPTELSLLFDECTDLQERVIIDLDGGRTVTMCLNSDGLPESIDPGGATGGLGSIGSTQSLAEVLRVLQLVRALTDLFGDDLDDALENVGRDIEEGVTDLLRMIASDLRTIAVALRLQRAQLGDLPSEEQQLDLKLELGQRWRYRNGIGLTSSVLLMGSEDNYAGKPLDVAFGDSFSPNTFTTSLGASLELPLGERRGRYATGGPEMAAEATLLAEQHVFAHTAADEALRTITEYWGLAGAQERLRRLAESAAINDQVLEATRTLIAADELPAAEISRPQARSAEVRRQVAAARQQVVEARIRLVVAMGQTTQRLEDTPLAGDSIGQDEAPSDGAASWMDRARSNRQDLAAAQASVVASDILVRTASANLRFPIDLTLNASFSGFAESFDTRLYDPSGYWDAMAGRIAGPSFRIGLRFALPFRNRTAKGRLLQARAAQAQGQITERDLDRQIWLRLQDVVASLLRKRAELARLHQTLDSQEATFEVSMERYRLGEQTLIDLLSTEQQLTAVRLAVVAAATDLSILQAQLQFESGMLLVGPADLESFDPTRLELAPPPGSGPAQQGA